MGSGITVALFIPPKYGYSTEGEALKYVFQGNAAHSTKENQMPTRTAEEWINEYKKRNALWIHDDDPRRPHARLSSGKHSNGFFNSELVMEDPTMLDDACADLLHLLMQDDQFNMEDVDRVAGPAMGAITIAHDVARHISRKRSRPCLRAYAVKVFLRGQEYMAFEKTRIDPGTRILFAEDVVTTGRSTDLTKAAVSEKNGIALPFVVALVNRSELGHVAGAKIFALINHHMPAWDQNECPLCELGSEAVPAKGNWERLNASH